MTKMSLDFKKLRRVFIVYIAMSPVNWVLLNPKCTGYNLIDLKKSVVACYAPTILIKEITSNFEHGQQQ